MTEPTARAAPRIEMSQLCRRTVVREVCESVLPTRPNLNGLTPRVPERSKPELMRRAGLVAIVVVSAGCVSMSYDQPIGAPTAPMLGGIPAAVRATIHGDRHELEILVGPFHMPAMSAGADHHPGHDAMYSPLVVLPWPVDGGLTGVRVATYTADGTPQPRDIIHHVIGVNFDRRQLVYPVPERLFGFGPETPDIKLPGFLEIPIQWGDSIGVYAVWSNTTGQALEDVYLQVVLHYAPPGRDREPALPIYLDTNNNIGGRTSFDLTPGRSLQSYEFELPVGGGLLAASGHLHDYGRELRIEEAATGRVVTRLKAELDPEGHMVAVEQRVYRRFFNLFDARIRLEAGVRYRVVGEYDNPTGMTIPDGGMAHIVGLFVPDDLTLWPKLDRSTDAYWLDLTSLPPRLGGHGPSMRSGR